MKRYVFLHCLEDTYKPQHVGVICSFRVAFWHRRNMNKNLWLFVVFAVTIQSGQSALFLPGQTFYLPFSTTYKIERGSYDLTFQCSKILVADGQVTKKDCVLKGIRIKIQGATRPRKATPRTAIASLLAVKNYPKSSFVTTN